MKTHVEFRSDKFPAYEGEEEQVNPDLWGRRLAEYLKHHLASEGIETGEPFPEDWGWCVPVVNDAFRLWIGCGHLQDHADSYLVFVEPATPTVRRWFRKIDTTERVGAVVAALERVISRDPEIRDVVWRDA